MQVESKLLEKYVSQIQIAGVQTHADKIVTVVHTMEEYLRSELCTADTLYQSFKVCEQIYLDNVYVLSMSMDRCIEYHGGMRVQHSFFPRKFLIESYSFHRKTCRIHFFLARIGNAIYLI